MPSFEIYGGVAGLYDYGPLGSQLKSNVETQWRQHFVLEDDMLEVTCSNLTLDEVLKTSVSYLELFEFDFDYIFLLDLITYQMIKARIFNVE